MSNRSSLLHTGAVPHQSRPTKRRIATFALETQAAYKFGLAILVGIGAIAAGLTASAGALILIVAILVASRALRILDAGDRTTFRPTGEAGWDAALATAWATIAIVLAADGATAGAFIAGSGAMILAILRLRTRYVV
ncbi:MAG: hypothetical protein J7513_12305 [Solirubrobacteraceae bacterium]|nr:hypothetical protein [Solirubrobacteraceae bacterium]